MNTATGLTGIALTAASYLGVHDGGTDVIDGHVTRTLTRHPSPYDRCIAIGSDLGSVFAVGGSAAILAATRRRALATDVLTCGVLAWTFAQAAKPLVERARPYTAAHANRQVAVPKGSSWPSGHTAVATAIAVTVAPQVKPAGRVILGAYALGVGLSRIRVGVHYASDVVAGAGVGLIAAAFTRRLRHAQRQ